MAIHISNKILSKNGIITISSIALLIGFIFTSLLIFYNPRDNQINFNSLSSLSIQSITSETKNQIATSDLGVYNVTKTLAKGGIPIIYSGPAKILNNDNENTYFTEILLSKGFITNGEDSWIDRKKPQNPNVKILDLSKFIEVKPKNSTIDINFESQTNQNDLNIDANESMDYGYFMNEKNLKISIENVANFLIELDPTNKDTYFKNQIELDTQISNTEIQYSNLLLCNKLPIITNSQNLSYLAQKYGLEISIFKNFDPANPQQNQIKYLKEFAKSKNTNSFFIDKQIPLINYNQLKKSLGLDIYLITPYIYADINDTLIKNLENLKKSQSCQ